MSQPFFMQERCSRPLIISVAIRWTVSRRSLSCCGAGSPELDTVVQMWPLQVRAEDHLHQFAGTDLVFLVDLILILVN